MIKLSTENELLSSFRPIDRDQVQIPADFRFPFPVKNFTSWIEPSGHRVYLVFADPASAPIGIVFQRTRGSSDAAPAMCQWCNKVRSGSGVSLMTVQVTPDRRIGIHLCSDLKCGENVAGHPSVHDIRESLTPSERIYRLMERMHDFAKKNLL